MLRVLIASGADLLPLAGCHSIVDSACVATKLDVASFALACGCWFALTLREIESHFFWCFSRVVCGLSTVNRLVLTKNTAAQRIGEGVRGSTACCLQFLPTPPHSPSLVGAGLHLRVVRLSLKLFMAFNVLFAAFPLDIVIAPDMSTHNDSRDCCARTAPCDPHCVLPRIEILLEKMGPRSAAKSPENELGIQMALKLLCRGHPSGITRVPLPCFVVRCERTTTCELRCLVVAGTTTVRIRINWVWASLAPNVMSHLTTHLKCAR